MDPEQREQLRSIYNKPRDPGSFGGVSRLQSSAAAKGIRDLTHDKVAEFLKSERAYTLHKPYRKNFPRNKTYVSGIDKQWQADLADMQALSRYNSGVKYLLTVIDVFSKYAWVVPVKSKSAKDMLAAFKVLLVRSAPRKPIRLQTDKGKEFFNSSVKTFLTKYGIEHFATHSDKKAAVVERFNRTLKSRIWRYFTSKQIHKYIDVLQDFVDSYNHSFHRSIKMRPVDVSKENETSVWVNLYGDGGRVAKKKGTIESGTTVRISKVKGDFDKGYIPNYSEESFVVERNIDQPIKLYKIRDYHNEEIDGTWYKEELQPIDQSENSYLVEKILKKRTLSDGSKEFLVKWKGYAAKFNSWVKESEVTSIHGYNPKRRATNHSSK